MRVSLGYAQYAACRYWGDDGHLNYLDQAERSKKRYVVSMPPAGWRVLAHLLGDAAWDRWGRHRASKLTGERSGTRSACHTVEKALVKLETHPAFSRFVVIGYSEDRFTAWEGCEPTFTPYPQARGAMVVLEPVTDEAVWTSVAGKAHRAQTTGWRAREWRGGDERFGLFPLAEHFWSDDADESP